jgi:outer membrane protein assembly factor BamB
MLTRLVFLVPLILLANFFARADKPDTWNQFRGPNGSGIRSDARIKIPSKENLIWKTRLPFGLSCPVLSEDKIFLTGIEQGRLVTLALDRKSGKLLWKKKAPETEIEKFHEASSPATPTPFVDQDRLFVYFGSFGLLCYDHDGKEIWKKPIPTPKS